MLRKFKKIENDFLCDFFFSYRRFFCVEYKKKVYKEKKLIETSDCLNASPFTLFLLQQENIFFWGKFMYKICWEFILFVWEKVFLVYFMLVFNNNLLFTELYNLNFSINWFFVVTFFCMRETFIWTVNVVDGEILSITKISRLHMAAYLCVASNGVPPSISKRVQLKVQCKSLSAFHLYKNLLICNT